MVTKNWPLISVYFAGSIKGGKACTENYPYIIELLKKHFIVLSEHLNRSHHQGEEPKKLSDVQIYERDINLIKKADFIIAEVTAPSHWVGYEIATATLVEQKPVFLLYQKGTIISAILSGSIPQERIFQRETKEDLATIISEIAEIVYENN